MGAFGSNSLNLSAGIEQQHLRVKSLELDLLLLARLQVQGLQALDFILLRHCSGSGGEEASGDGLGERRGWNDELLGDAGLLMIAAKSETGWKCCCWPEKEGSSLSSHIAVARLR